MNVKKIANADFHLANKLHGSKSTAKYGVFKTGSLVGFARCNGGVWDAWTNDSVPKRLNSFSCSSLAQLKNHLATK